jgi:hypothetical protein
MLTAPHPCGGCLFWYRPGAFPAWSRHGAAHCEIVDDAPIGPCDKALVPLAREVLGLPMVRVVPAAAAEIEVEA